MQTVEGGRWKVEGGKWKVNRIKCNKRRIQGATQGNPGTRKVEHGTPARDWLISFVEKSNGLSCPFRNMEPGNLS
jgi:hypothetical protein